MVRLIAAQPRWLNFAQQNLAGDVFLDLLIEQSEKEKLEKHIITKNISMLDMDFAEESFDIIWSEGALYLMGFQNGLKRCHQFLKKNGHLAVTELVYTTPNPPEPVVEYLEREYPDIKNMGLS